MKTYNECTPEEVNDYNLAQQDAADTHTRGIGKLKLRNLHPDVKEDEIAENNERIADLKADRAIVRARRDAFYASRAQIEPPTQPQLQGLKRDLEDVNRLTAQRRILEEVVKLAADALNTFGEIQSQPA